MRAHTKHIRISPRKLRLVCDQVRGLGAEQALVLLALMPQKGAALVAKTLSSALASAENNFDLNPGEMVVTEIYAGDAPRQKRFKAGARGRYKPRTIRFSHLTVVLAEREG